MSAERLRPLRLEIIKHRWSMFEYDDGSHISHLAVCIKCGMVRVGGGSAGASPESVYVSWDASTVLRKPAVVPPCREVY